MKEKIEQFANAIKQANEAARAASLPDDGGTCNLDSVVIDFSGWRQTQIDQVQQLSGVQISAKLSGMWKGYCFVQTAAHGQANNRTRMVEAAYQKLKELGIPASVYYAMD